IALQRVGKNAFVHPLSVDEVDRDVVAGKFQAVFLPVVPLRVDHSTSSGCHARIDFHTLQERPKPGCRISGDAVPKFFETRALSESSPGHVMVIPSLNHYVRLKNTQGGFAAWIADRFS